MTGVGRARSTPEFKEVAARIVLGGQMLSCAAKTVCLSNETSENRRNAEAAGGLRALTGTIGAEQMEIARLCCEGNKAGKVGRPTAVAQQVADLEAETQQPSSQEPSSKTQPAFLP